MKPSTLLVTALLITSPIATAQTVSTSVGVNVNIDVQFPQVQVTPTVLTGLLAFGTTVAFLNSGGVIVATVSPAGAIVPVAGMNTAAATRVQVVTNGGSGIVVREAFPLATPLPRTTSPIPKDKTAKIEVINAAGKKQRIPLVAVMKRQSDKVRAMKANGQNPGRGNGSGNGNGKGR